MTTLVSFLRYLLPFLCLEIGSLTGLEYSKWDRLVDTEWGPTCLLLPSLGLQQLTTVLVLGFELRTSYLPGKRPDWHLLLSPQSSVGPSVWAEKPVSCSRSTPSSFSTFLLSYEVSTSIAQCERPLSVWPHHGARDKSAVHWNLWHHVLKSIPSKLFRSGTLQKQRILTKITDKFCF